MNKMPILIAFIVLIALSITACSAKPDAFSLAGTSWKLVSYGPVEAQTFAAEEIDTQIDFSADGKVSGTVGCNRFSGSYELKEDQLTFGPLMATKMACPDLPMTQEIVAFGVMVGTVKIELSENQLTIFSKDGTQQIILQKK